MSAKILSFSGSSRAGSFNQLLVDAAANAAEEAGASVTRINLADFDLPIFNEDLERESNPEKLAELKEIFKAHDGLLIASPEYNSSLTALLKNSIDWVTRPADGEKPLECFSGKAAALFAASPGGLGGLRGLVHLRAILQNIGVMVYPKQYALSKAHDAFDDQGMIKDEKQRDIISQISRSLVETIQKLNG